MKKIIIFVSILLFIGALIVTAIASMDIHKNTIDEINKEWNNGICNICGGTYKFRCVTYVHGDHCYYACEECDKTVMTRSLNEIDNEWNNGICKLCGGTYKFRCVTYVHGNRCYYACEKCDHIVMMRSLQK